MDKLDRSPPQRETEPARPPTVGSHMASMSDIDLEALATTDMLPTVHTPTSEDYQKVADGRAARTELFKRALRTPIAVKPGHAP